MVRTCNGTELQPQDYVGGRCPSYDDLPHYSGCRIHGPKEEDVVTPPMVEPHRRLHFCPDLQRAMESVHYIADHTRRYEDQMSNICRDSFHEELKNSTLNKLRLKMIFSVSQWPRMKSVAVFRSISGHDCLREHLCRINRDLDLFIPFVIFTKKWTCLTCLLFLGHQSGSATE
ncbi:acetylcholine receptor subunit alpha-like protein [Trichonephila clavata]|uniref:Acetylcholine receptor subunit alpha-like protein n=1 Tax=Trichonephila clavata TaxID=2740835 RepID=A0A8X6GZ06_TRICU|nr:acetylcholine receptor subunit alpha-like protein [Trichonephila clavata]